jgi:hypothetical protein
MHLTTTTIFWLNLTTFSKSKEILLTPSLVVSVTIRAIVLGCRFESRLHLKIKWKAGPLDGRTIAKIIKTAKCGNSQTKSIFLSLLTPPDTILKRGMWFIK